MKKKQMSRFQRKLRKLFRDPRQFFQDARIMRLLLGEEEAPPTFNPGGKSYENPMILGEITVELDGYHGIVLEKKVAQEHLATIFFVRKERGAEIDDFCLELVDDPEFIGFKERYLYFMLYENSHRLTTEEEIAALFRKEGMLKSGVLNRFRNLFFVNPESLLPFALRAGFCNCRLCLVLTEDYAYPEMIEEYAGEIDVLIHHRALAISDDLPIRNAIAYGDGDALENLVKMTIINNGAKEKNVFLPIRQIDDIETYLESDFDALLFLKRPLASKETPCTTMGEITAELLEALDTLLVREEVYQRYQSLCDRERMGEMLGFVLEDGIRIKVVEHG